MNTDKKVLRLNRRQEGQIPIPVGIGLMMGRTILVHPVKAKKYSTLMHTVDALVESTDEGRIRLTISFGELPKSFDPKISE